MLFYSEMEFRQRLGSGGFADVFEGFYEGRPVAVKKMKASTKNPAATSEAFEVEASLQPLHHHHVISILTVIREPEKLSVMELVPEARTLQRVIDSESDYKWRDFAQQLAAALTYLHHLNILHLDIKPANILVTGQNDSKVIDFGCSQHTDNPRVSPLQGTVAYRAPELFRNQLPTPKADIYSLAITLWPPKTRQTPYDGENNERIVYQVVAQHRRPARDPDFEAMWTADPRRRPEADQLSF